jgi:hypothetical protein
MKKILVVINAELVPHHLAAAAIGFATATSSFLHIMFTNYAMDLSEYNYPFPNDLSLTRNVFTGQTLAEENNTILQDNIRLFENQCKQAGVNYFIEPGNDIRLEKLIVQSAFSDFIMADANDNFQQGHIADLLHNTHCPVYLISKEAKTIENIVFTYDGSNSSMYAIKAFTYLFRELTNKPCHLVYIATDEKGTLPQEQEIRNWLSIHYNNVQIHILRGHLRAELTGYIKTTGDALVVMGAFGRNPVSNLFRKSLAYAVIEEGNASLFIAHPSDALL